MSETKPEQRTVDVDVGELSTEGNTLRGHAAVFNVLSEDLGGYRERIAPGAFSGVLDDDVRLLVDHKPPPLARTKADTLKLSQDATGLAFEAQLPNTSAARDLRESVSRGDIDGASFRFTVGEESWDGDVRTVTKVKSLTDITAATYPAYPEASIELRARPTATTSTPTPGDGREETSQSMDNENKSEGRSEERTEDTETRSEERVEEAKPAAGSLRMTERTIQVKDENRSFMHEVADFAQDVKRGETRSLSTAISLSNPEYGTSLFDLLRPQSVFLSSGVQTLSTDSDSVVYPLLTADATDGWVAEGGTISASDPTFGAGTVVPHKLAVRVEYSNEAAEDSTPGLEGVLRSALAARGAVSVDVAAFQGSGTPPEPQGMGGIAGTSVNAAGLSTGDITWAGTAVSFLEGNAAPRPFAYVGGPNLVRNLRETRVGSGGAVDEYLFPVGAEEVPTIWGAQGFVAPHLTAGTAYVYSPSSCYVVNRTSGFDIEIDRSRLFHTDSSEMRLRARLDFFFPYTGAIARGTAVPA